MQPIIRTESSLEKLDRAILSKPCHYLGLPVYCLQLCVNTGYVAKVRIDASTETEALAIANKVMRQVKKEGWMENILDSLLYSSHLFDAFTDKANDFFHN